MRKTQSLTECVSCDTDFLAELQRWPLGPLTLEFASCQASFAAMWLQQNADDDAQGGGAPPTPAAQLLCELCGKSPKALGADMIRDMLLGWGECCGAES